MADYEIIYFLSVSHLYQVSGSTEPLLGKNRICQAMFFLAVSDS